MQAILKSLLLRHSVHSLHRPDLRFSFREHLRELLAPVRPVLLGTMFLVLSSTAGATVGGAVFIQTNSTTDNAVWMYSRANNGQLTFVGAFSTQGIGGIEPGSQGNLALWDNNKYLYTANAGSNDITVFKVKGTGLTFQSKVPSGGNVPVSIAIYGNLLYVLNAQGTAGNITGFTIHSDGSLLAVPNSTRPLSDPEPKAVQVGFTPDGTTLLVTETHTSLVDTYIVGPDGTSTGPMLQPSAGSGPFGFAFDPAGHLVISDVRNSGASSYTVSGGVLQTASSYVKDFGKAACWVANPTDPTLPYSYITNTNSDTVSGYSIAADGTLTLLNSDGKTAVLPTGAFPLDIIISKNNKYVYVLEQLLPGIAGFRIMSDGSLVQIQDLRGTPNTSWGMTGY